MRRSLAALALFVATTLLARAGAQPDPYVDASEQLVTEVHVRDLGRSIEFYRSLGFELVRRADTFAELSWEGVLFFLDSAQQPPAVTTPAANVRVMVADVDAYWERVQRLDVPVLKPIADKYYGLRDFTVLDPDGFGIRFASRRAPQDE